MSTELYRKCSKCGAIPLQDDSVSFHRFPKPGKTNILRAKAWAIYCWPEKDWSSVESLFELYNKHKMLCGRHFEGTCYMDVKKKRLSRFSIPGSSDYALNLLSSLREVPSINASAEIVDTPTTSAMEYMPVAGPSGLQKPITMKLAISINNETTSSHFASISGPSGVISYQKKLPTTSNIEEVCIPMEEVEPLQSIPVSGPSGLHRSHEISQVHTKREELLPNKKGRGILKPLDINKIEQLTNRERRLYFLARKSIKEINRLRKEIKNRKDMQKIENICKDHNVQKLLNLKISPSFVVLLQGQLRNCTKKQKGRRYSLEDKILALSLFKKSPTCYRLLRRLFTLPSQGTLNELLNKVPLQAGINKHVFDALEEMGKSNRENQNICTLLFDEMAIKKNFVYNQRYDVIEGFQDHGNHGRSEKVASNALVFMLCGIRKKWKQPVAFYFSGKSVTADRLAVLIKNVLDECFRIKLNVVSTVCDLSRVNIKALDILGSTTDAPYFIHQGKEIVTILDPPHLLKCLRNLFIKYNVECEIDAQSDGKIIKGTAKWEHIQKFYECEKKHGNFVYMPCLTEAHIYPNNKQKMRVKLAAQVLSYSMTSGLNARIVGQELPSEAIATLTLTDKFDKLFDCLNADSADLRRGKIHSTNLSKASPHLNFFKEMKAFIKKMKFINCKNPPPSQYGWIRTINAVERLWHILQKSNIESLSTRRLNQDPLENFFGCIRYNCGSNDNPTVGQFIAGVKTAIINNLRNNSYKKNCEDDSGILFNNFTTFLNANVEKENVEPTVQHTQSNTDELLADAAESVELSTSEAQACAYVCGFIVRKLNVKDCIFCKNIFLTSVNEPIHIFTSFKEYNTVQDSLTYVSKAMVHCVEFCASILNNFFKKNSWRLNIKDRALSTLDVVDFSFLNDCQEHFEKNLYILKRSVFFICIKQYCVKENRKFNEEEKEKKLQKKLAILKNK